jgi:hypothetical protein
MKKVIYSLAIMALLLPACAYDQAEFEAFADGAIAATNVYGAQWDVQNDTISVISPATSLEIEDINFAYSKAKKLSIAADAIAQHFPGKFNNSAGGVRIGSEPYVAVMIFY